MRIISVFLIFCLIQISFCANLLPYDSASDEDGDDGGEDAFGMKPSEKQLLTARDNDDNEDDEDVDNPDNVHNQDDADVEPNGEGSQPNPSNAVQPNEDQNRGLPGAPNPENLPLPDYSAVNTRGYLPQCHSGQYQCQKTDQSVPTRCIPQEWRCNGMRDCENNDDESGCSTDQLTRGRTQAKCTQEQYQCHGTGINSVPPLCIERRFVCDGTYHCSYGDDEANCADRRQPTTYPNRVPQRNENNGQMRPDTNDQTSGRADPRDAYNRPQTSDRQNTNDRKSEEYVQRLEWRDRCFRSCLKY